MIGVVLAGILLGSCAGVPTDDIELDAQGAPGFEIGQYSSYAWLGSAQIVNDPQGEWEPDGFDADAEVRFLIDRELRQRGMIEVVRKPDLLVGFLAGIDMESLDLRDIPDQEVPVLEKTSRGALAIVLINPDTRQPMWAGAATATLNKDRSIHDIRARLDYAVSGIFKLIQ
jgi:hypothetical protein